MAVAGIIAEFNPFHNGHRYLLSEARKIAPDGVVVVLGGNFTQRGEPALCDKHYRAAAALCNGADLVLELPIAFSLATAQTFAFGGVAVLTASGLVDTLVFGSECGDIARLSAAANAVEDIRTENELQVYLQKGLPFPAAREAAVRQMFGDRVADVLHNPNDILGVEYLRAVHAYEAPFSCVSVPRVGNAHDAQSPCGAYASATLLREKIRAGEAVADFMPQNAYEILQTAVRRHEAPSDYTKLDMAVLSFLRTASPADFAGVPDVSEGIENRILAAARTAKTLWTVFDTAKTKRYTHARIRRVVLAAFLGLQTELQQIGVPYLRVLGFTERGKDLLRTARDSAKLPIIMRASDIEACSPAAQEMFRLECKSTDIFNLALPEIRNCGTEMTDNLVRL
ncbi:MAG: nucleotidyltransferase family protein [Candidatus Fimenecus sp.]